jgi:hypothetical protein
MCNGETKIRSKVFGVARNVQTENQNPKPIREDSVRDDSAPF